MTRALLWGMRRYRLMKGGDEGECEKNYEPDGQVEICRCTREDSKAMAGGKRDSASRV
jgi:hypothetical protein